MISFCFHSLCSIIYIKYAFTGLKVMYSTLSLLVLTHHLLKSSLSFLKFYSMYLPPSKTYPLAYSHVTLLFPITPHIYISRLISGLLTIYFYYCFSLFILTTSPSYLLNPTFHKTHSTRFVFRNMLNPLRSWRLVLHYLNDI